MKFNSGLNILTVRAVNPRAKRAIFISSKTILFLGFDSFWMASSISIERNRLVLDHAMIIANPTVIQKMTAAEIRDIPNLRSYSLLSNSMNPTAFIMKFAEKIPIK